LWSLPEVAHGTDLHQFARERFGLDVELAPPLARLSHTFTHFRLHIMPQPLKVTGRQPVLQQAGTVWLGLEDAVGAALPTPVRTLIKGLK
jgi:A/G-specific adenine glycosylase